MTKRGYQQSQENHVLFIKHSTQSKITTLIIYVDDIVVTEDDLEEIGKLRTYFANELEIKDLGSLRYILRIEVVWSKQGIFIFQQKYVLNVLKGIGLLGCKPFETPIKVNHKLGEKKMKQLVTKGHIKGW